MEGPSEGGQGSQVKEKRVWVNTSTGQGWAEPQHCVTELLPVRIHLAEQDKGTAVEKKDNKGTENYCKYLSR